MVTPTPSSYSGSAFTVPSPPPDGSTVATVQVANSAAKNGLVTREFYLKFEFTATSNAKAVEVHLHHRQIMYSILKAHGKQVTLFDKHDIPIEIPRIATITNVASHQQLFVTHTKIGTKVRNTRHTIIQKVRSSISLHEIKHTDSITHHLKNLNIFIREHHFPIDVFDIVSLGWLRFLHPDHMMYDCIRTDINAAILLTSGPKTVIPHYHMTTVSPSFKDEQDEDMRTKGIQILVSRADQRVLDKLLKKAFEQNPLYVPWRVKHQDPNSYRQNLRAQHKYLFQTFTVPISGVNRMEMFYFRERIMATGLASSVQPTRTTDTIGRWNVLVKRDDFKEATKQFRAIINDYDEIVPNEKERSTWSYPRMVGKNVTETYGEDESEGDKSYMSASIASLASYVTVEDLDIPVTMSTTTFDLSALGVKSFAAAVKNQPDAAPPADTAPTAREVEMQAKIDKLEARVLALIEAAPKPSGQSTQTTEKTVPSDVIPDSADSLPVNESLTHDTSAIDELTARQQAYEDKMTAQAESQAAILAETSASLKQIMLALKIHTSTSVGAPLSGKHEAPDANSLEERSSKMADLKDTPIKSHPMPDAVTPQNP